MATHRRKKTLSAKRKKYQHTDHAGTLGVRRHKRSGGVRFQKTLGSKSAAGAAGRRTVKNRSRNRKSNSKHRKKKSHRNSKK
jgi:hypothetical protein